ncbi:hypothetical protein J7T55_014846 [Diaporthe amygdali]|uniref:uncharacterized protein n=1 Tax=Phomopsis amygdali TaxID=1214568 RepID=UPI0022FDD059|nr:uncharacterized protein J7T55_014846 [Diaporthe amygdali]KAJ0110043.1 hypothetical protein J7T55_014846 [Diaporthe amygdali]
MHEILLAPEASMPPMAPMPLPCPIPKMMPAVITTVIGVVRVVRVTWVVIAPPSRMAVSIGVAMVFIIIVLLSVSWGGWIDGYETSAR